MTASSLRLLMIHGYPLDHRLWDGQKLLAASEAPGGPSGTAQSRSATSRAFELRAFDLPGFGGRAPFEARPEDVTVVHYAEAVRDEIRSWGDEPVVLVALSMGGYVAFECWRRFREKIAGLVLCDTRAEGDAPEARAARLAGVERARTGQLGPMFEQMSKDLIAPSRRDDAPFRARVLAQMEAANPVGVEQALFAMMSRPDSRSDLGGITVPTLVIVGEHDGLTPPATAETMANAIPGAGGVVIPGAGHLAPMEQPGEVNAAIRDFLLR